MNNILEQNDFVDAQFFRPNTTESDRFVSDTAGYLPEQEKNILDYLQTHQNITSKEAEELLHVKERRTRELLKQMCEKNLLIKLGSARSTHYKLSKAVGDE